MRHNLLKAWYQLTKYWPRPIPETKEDFEKLKNILQLYFGTADASVAWITVASEIQNTRSKFLRKPLYLYANVARKIEINGMCENEKRFEGRKLQARLKELSEASIKEDEDGHMPEGTSDLREEVPGLQ